MHPLGTVLNLAPPLKGGALVGRWRTASDEGPRWPFARARAGLLVGLLTMEISLVGGVLLWMVLYHWLLGRRLADSGEVLADALEFLAFAIFFGVVGAVLGTAGGLVGGLRPVRRTPPDPIVAP